MIGHAQFIRRMYVQSLNPSLRDSSGKELRRLHDITNQHLRALKASGYEPSGEFITSLLELKLDQPTMCEWQKFTQEPKKVHHYSKLLVFLDLQAQGSDNTTHGERRHQCPPDKRAALRPA